MKRKFVEFALSANNEKSKHPYLTGTAPIIRCQTNVYPHTIVLGSFPSIKSFGQNLTAEDVKARGGSGPQCFGNPKNCFFNIVGTALGFSRSKVSYEQQIKIFCSNGFCLWDVLAQCQRKGSLDSAINFNTQVHFKKLDSSTETLQDLHVALDLDNVMLINNIPELLSLNPSIERIVFHKTAARIVSRRALWKLYEEECRKKHIRIQFFMNVASSAYQDTRRIFSKLPTKEELVAGFRGVEVIVLPSTSPANAKLRPFHKEVLWHRGCFRLEKPGEFYECPACKAGDHWLSGCPGLNRWRAIIKTSKFKSPFNWYI